jgi:hypothetical protein
LPAIFAASYTLLLPGTRTGPLAGALGGCTLSGMLNAHAGRQLGTDNGACARNCGRQQKREGKNSNPSDHTRDIRKYTPGTAPLTASRHRARDTVGPRTATPEAATEPA